MKIVALAFSLSLLLSCKDKTQKLIESNEKFIDSLNTAKKVDSMMADVMNNVYFDTLGIDSAAIQIKKAWLSTKEYSNYRDLSFTYKNVSNKKVSAIRFRWYGINAFGDPADMGTGSMQEGFGGGFDDDPISPGNSRTVSFSILSRNAKKVIRVWPTEIAFEDGTKWKSNSKSRNN